MEINLWDKQLSAHEVKSIVVHNSHSQKYRVFHYFYLFSIGHNYQHPFPWTNGLMLVEFNLQQPLHLINYVFSNIFITSCCIFLIALATILSPIEFLAVFSSGGSRLDTGTGCLHASSLSLSLSLWRTYFHTTAVEDQDPNS